MWIQKRRGKCGGGGWDISYRNDGEIDEKRAISRTENATTFLEPSSYFVSFFNCNIGLKLNSEVNYEES